MKALAHCTGHLLGSWECVSGLAVSCVNQSLAMGYLAIAIIIPKES
jgi:hypothetical protein